MAVERGSELLVAATDSIFAAVEFEVSRNSAFAVAFYVEAGAEATFTVEGGSKSGGVESWADISGGTDLAALTVDARIDFGADDFAGTYVRVACTVHNGGGDVAVLVDRVES